MSYDPNLPPDPTNFWDPRNDWNDVKARTSGGLPLPGGGGILMLAILYLIMLLSIAAAVSAIVAGPVVRVFGKLIDWDDPPSWGASFAAAFFGFFAYFLISIFQVEAGGKEMYRVTEVMWTLPWWEHTLSVFALPILACASVMWWWLRKSYYAYAGIVGWLRAFVVAVLCHWISTVVIATSARRVISGENESVDGYIAGFLGLGMVAGGFAAIGGIGSAVLIYAGTRVFGDSGETRPGVLRSYATAVLLLLTYLLGSLAFEFCFNALDAVYLYVKGKAPLPEGMSEFQYLLPYALGFVCQQLAIVGFAGGILQWREGDLFPGRRGWLVATLVAFIAIAATVVPFGLIIAAMASSGEFKEIFQYF